MKNILKNVALDNVALLTHRPDRDAIWHLFERIGFTLHPLGRQSGPLSDGGIGPHGSGSRTANFHLGGYFELLSIEEAHLPAGSYPERIATIGSHIGKVTIGVPDPVATCQALRDLDEQMGAPDHYTRTFTREDGSHHECGFLLFRYPPRQTMNLQLTGGLHLTREVTWQPDLLTHENGTLILAGASAIATHPEQLRADMARLLGLAEEDYTTHGLRLPDKTHINIYPPAHFSWTQRPLPLINGAFYAEAVFAVASLAQTERRLRDEKISYLFDRDDIVIDLTGLARMVCRFRQWTH